MLCLMVFGGAADRRGKLTRGIWAIGLLSAVLLPQSAGAAAQEPDVSDQQPPAATLPETIPLFPLQDVVLFPGLPEPLHIFEARYRAMVADALEGDRVIGMVLLQPGFESDYDGRPPIYQIGCAGEIVDAEQLPDGRFNIVLHGLVRFRIISEEQDGPYRRARVEALPDPPETDDGTAVHLERGRLVDLLAEFVDRPGLDMMIPPMIPDEDLVHILARQLTFEPFERQILLEQSSLHSRFQALIGLLESKLKPLR